MKPNLPVLHIKHTARNNPTVNNCSLSIVFSLNPNKISQKKEPHKTTSSHSRVVNVVHFSY